MLPYFALYLSYTRIFIPLVTVCTDGAFTVGVRRKKEGFPLPGDKIFVKYSFMQFGLSEADTLKSISILIYSISEQSIYTQNGWPGPIFCEIKARFLMIFIG
jgi:hypothetical protein